MYLSKKGMTLFELIVVIALFMVVIGAGFSLLLAGNNSFTRSKLRSDIQFEVRMVSDFIRDELRNATEIELINGSIDYIDDNEYIIIDGNIIKHVIGGVTVADDIITPKITFTVTEFTPMFILEDVGSKNMISFHLEGTDSRTLGTKSYNVITKVLLNNIKDYDAATGQAIRYKKP